nr:hypothetical protein [Tanacetum cinerariifolium]
MPSKDNLYNGRKGIGFENPSYFGKAKDLRPMLYDEKVIGLGYTLMFLTQFDEDTFSNVRRPKHSSVVLKNKGSSNTSNVDLSAVSDSKLNKNVKRYSRKDLLACNNSHLGETSSAFVCNNAMNVSCDSRMNDLLDDNNFFILDDENVRISPVSKMPFRKKPHDSINHMTGNRALLTNFVEKFLGTVRFGNNNFAMIAGYEDVGLEFAFRKSTCFVQNEDGVDLLIGDRSSNLYTIALNEVASNSLTCLLAKASSSQSWLWHQRLSHLNFATINNLVKNNLVQVSQVDEASKNDLKDLFQDFYNEYFDSSMIMKSSTTNVKTSINEEVFHEVSESSQGESSSSSLNDDVQQSPDTLFHDPSNVHSYYQPFPHEKKWTKDHTLHKIIGDPKSSVRTRGQLANSCLFSCFLSFIEPANVDEALRDADWVSAMQEELDQFSRLKVW